MAKKDVEKPYKESLEERRSLLKQVVQENPEKALELFISRIIDGEPLLAARNRIPKEIVLDKIDEIIAEIRSSLHSS